MEVRVYSSLRRYVLPYSVLKVAKLKGPLIFAGVFMVVYDNLFCWDKPQVFGLKILEFMRDLNDHP